MRNTKCCPKCHSNDILRLQGERQGYGLGNNIRAGVTLLSSVLVTKYLCCNCGFIEDWVDNPQDIEKIKKYHLKNTK